MQGLFIILRTNGSSPGKTARNVRPSYIFQNPVKPMLCLDISGSSFSPDLRVLGEGTIGPSHRYAQLPPDLVSYQGPAFSRAVKMLKDTGF